MQAAVTPERLATIPAESQRFQLSKRIKQKFLSEGFEDVRIVAATALEQERDRLSEWIARGYHVAARTVG